MYAIVKTGGKQYKVQKDDILKVELLDNAVGDKVDLDVVMLADEGVLKIGDDVATAKVVAEVVYNGRGAKINIFTYKAKKNIRKRKGHRQPFSELKILEING